jgi:hypothetical protein
MKAKLITICLIFVSAASGAQGTRDYLGSGNSSCGEWLTEKNEMLQDMRTNWVLGYLSGINFMASKNFLDSYEYKGIKAAVDKYCRENPLKKVVDASNDIAFQMMRMTK